MKFSSKKIGKNIASTVVAIILMFSVIVTIGVVFLKTTLVNENTYKKVFESAGIYDKVYESINENIEYALVVNNIPVDTLDGVLSKNDVTNTINTTTESFIDFINGGDNFVISHDLSIYSKRVDTNINKFLRDKNMYLNEEQSKDLDFMKQNIIKIIDKELQIINFNELSKSSPMIMLSKIVGILANNFVIAGIIVLDIMLMSLFVPIWGRRKVRAYAWSGYSLVGAGMVVFLLSFSGYISGFYEYVIIATPYIAETVGLVIKKYLFNMSVISGIVVLMGIVSMSFYWKHLYKRYAVREDNDWKKSETLEVQNK